MSKTFNAAQRAARKGKKRQDRKLKAKLHKAEYNVVKYADRKTAMAMSDKLDRRDERIKRKHHTRKADS